MEWLECPARQKSKKKAKAKSTRRLEESKSTSVSFILDYTGTEAGEENKEVSEKSVDHHQQEASCAKIPANSPIPLPWIKEEKEQAKANQRNGVQTNVSAPDKDKSSDMSATATGINVSPYKDLQKLIESETLQSSDKPKTKEQDLELKKDDLHDLITMLDQNIAAKTEQETADIMTATATGINANLYKDLQKLIESERLQSSDKPKTKEQEQGLELKKDDLHDLISMFDQNIAAKTDQETRLQLAEEETKKLLAEIDSIKMKLDSISIQQPVSTFPSTCNFLTDKAATTAIGVVELESTVNCITMADLNHDYQQLLNELTTSVNELKKYHAEQQLLQQQQCLLNKEHGSKSSTLTLALGNISADMAIKCQQIWKALKLVKKRAAVYLEKRKVQRRAQKREKYLSIIFEGQVPPALGQAGASGAAAAAGCSISVARRTQEMADDGIKGGENVPKTSVSVPMTKLYPKLQAGGKKNIEIVDSNFEMPSSASSKHKSSKTAVASEINQNGLDPHFNDVLGQIIEQLKMMTQALSTPPSSAATTPNAPT